MQEIKMMALLFVTLCLFRVFENLVSRLRVKFKDYLVVIHWDGITYCEIKDHYFGFDDILKTGKAKSFRLFKHGKPSGKRPTSGQDKS